MAHRFVEIVIGRLVTDEAFRAAYQRSPQQTPAALANNVADMVRSKVDAIFTDVVLPGASGRELADQIRRLYPHMPVLYTTGYTRNAIVHQGRLDPDVHLLNKPYTQQDLAHKVRELLDRA